MASSWASETNGTFVDGPLLGLPAEGWLGDLGDGTDTAGGEEFGNVDGLTSGRPGGSEVVVLVTNLVDTLR